MIMDYLTHRRMMGHHHKKAKGHRPRANKGKAQPNLPTLNITESSSKAKGKDSADDDAANTHTGTSPPL